MISFYPHVVISIESFLSTIISTERSERRDIAVKIYCLIGLPRFARNDRVVGMFYYLHFARNDNT
ncbi:MAG: hypothetical protein PHE89_07970 [Alphaproteobacteria bacterium]|nr:hypothetical protein [Alphaproteobacteria bacterium]